MRQTSDGPKPEKRAEVEKCPVCDSHSIEMGYGMAGGGMGVYKYCESCGIVFDKVQTGDF